MPGGLKHEVGQVVRTASLVEVQPGAVVSREVAEGEIIIMPADVPHALTALTPFKMMLVMIRA
jgi:hypothetical protein